MKKITAMRGSPLQGRPLPTSGKICPQEDKYVYKVAPKNPVPWGLASTLETRAGCNIKCDPFLISAKGSELTLYLQALYKQEENPSQLQFTLNSQV